MRIERELRRLPVWFFVYNIVWMLVIQIFVIRRYDMVITVIFPLFWFVMYVIAVRRINSNDIESENTGGASHGP